MEFSIHISPYLISDVELRVLKGQLEKVVLGLTKDLGDKHKIYLAGNAKMTDGTTAYLSKSRKYFIRREPEVHNWDSIKYYDLEGERIQLAKGQCTTCQEVIESKHCGHYVTCSCGASSVDTDRGIPELHRYLGPIKSLPN